VVDEAPWPGGQIWRGERAKPSLPQARQWIERFQKSGAVWLDRSTVFAAPKPGSLLAEHPEGAREIAWRKLVLATGARELFLPFPGWDMPGVMGAGGVQALVKNGWPIAGKRVVVCGSGPLLLAVADGLKQYGAHIVCIAEQAPLSQLAGFGFSLLRHPGKIAQGIGLQSRLRGVPYRRGVWPVEAVGAHQVTGVKLTDGRRLWQEECDVIACGFNLVPNVELPVALGCALADGFVRVDTHQRTSAQNIFCAGEPTGIGGADCALTEGQIAGYCAADAPEKAAAFFNQRERWHSFRAAMAKAFALRAELKALATDQTILCRCEDVPWGRVKKFGGWREAKLLSRCGMGACQGRTCGAAAKFLLGWGMESVRPPVLPVRLGGFITTKDRY
jgi:NADPH-dependent 2,4-dienoyl-CoA reductase/sulfur reductase-like enzyme